MRSISLVLCLFLTGCSTLQQSASLRDNLANRGPVSLSNSNPYLASNILLSQEVDTSSTLKGFLKVRGNPDAIEVKKVLLRPYTLYFFYMPRQEVYILEESNHDWIIRGPQTTPEPVLEVLERVVIKKGDISKESSSSEKVSSAGIELGASPLEVEKASDISDEGGEVVKSPPLPAAASTAASHTEPAVKSAASSAATATSDEDIQHTVQYKGETLRLIAEWYTGTIDLAPKIARINGLTDPNVLSMGQTIRIPRYLVKNSAPLTKMRVDEYAKK